MSAKTINTASMDAKDASVVMMSAIDCLRVRQCSVGLKAL